MFNYYKMLCDDKIIYFSSSIILTKSNPVRIRIEENKYGMFDGYVIDMKTLANHHITRTTTLKDAKKICKAYVLSTYGLIKKKTIKKKSFINS